MCALRAQEPRRGEVIALLRLGCSSNEPSGQPSDDTFGLRLELNDDDLKTILAFAPNP